MIAWEFWLLVFAGVFPSSPVVVELSHYSSLAKQFHHRVGLDGGDPRSDYHSLPAHGQD